MKRLKAMAAIMAAATILSTGVVPVCAADASYDVAAVEAEIMEDAAVQSEIQALSESKDLTKKAFDWKGLQSGETRTIVDAAAYKVDNSDVSMANGGLATGSTVTKNSDGTYTLAIKTQPMEQTFLGTTATGTISAATATYYLNGGETTKACTVEGNTVTLVLEADAMGLAFKDGDTTNAGSKDNMIQVSFESTISPSWVGAILPSAMKNPTALYAFNVPAAAE